MSTVGVARLGLGGKGYKVDNGFPSHVSLSKALEVRVPPRHREGTPCRGHDQNKGLGEGMYWSLDTAGRPVY